MSDKLNINIEKTLGDFSLDVKQVIPVTGITALFGPSGAGKSSLLKLIAGFELPDVGRLSLGDKTWFDKANKINIPPHKRPIGYMFQEGRLFPHLTVKQNLDFAAQRAPQKISINHVISTFDVVSLSEQLPKTLSGGERRRVELARTVLTAPDILLLDEPLTGLDRNRKREILPFIESLPLNFNIPCLYVTHDIEEVSRLADNVMVMSQGRISAFGSAADILSHLDATPLHSEYDISSLFEGRISHCDTDLCLVQADIDGALITLPIVQGTKLGDRIRLRIRAGDVSIATLRPESVSLRNIFEVDIMQVTRNPKSAYAMVTLTLAGHELRARITRASWKDLKLEVGQTAFAMIKSVSFAGRL